MSFAVMAITGALIWFQQQGKLKLTTMIIILALVFGGDMWRVSKRYLNNDDFVSEREYKALFNPSAADQAILQDKDPHYRVINVTRSPWTDGGTCYFHENIGGHHAAKLQRYQDLIENQLSNQLQVLNGGLMQREQQVLLNPQVAQQMPVYNMLNTKYYIVQANNPGGAVRNAAACGNAWFVDEVRTVNNADEEMAALGSFDPLQTAIVNEAESDGLKDYAFSKSGDARIQLTTFEPNHLVYSTHNSQDGLAVFSEIYYDQGWDAFIDGEPAEIQRVNYVLRAIKIPAGDHEVEMRFEPASFQTGMNISLAGSVIFVLFAGGLIYVQFKQRADS
jgi:hypothetical protein